MTLIISTERVAEDIIHLVQENESIHLSDKSRWDIFSNVRESNITLQSEIEKIREENPWKRWNEFKLYLKREKPPGYEELLKVMERLDRQEYIRSK